MGARTWTDLVLLRSEAASKLRASFRLQSTQRRRRPGLCRLFSAIGCFPQQDFKGMRYVWQFLGSHTHVFGVSEPPRNKPFQCPLPARARTTATGTPRSPEIRLSRFLPAGISRFSDYRTVPCLPSLARTQMMPSYISSPSGPPRCHVFS